MSDHHSDLGPQGGNEVSLWFNSLRVGFRLLCLRRVHKRSERGFQSLKAGIQSGVGLFDQRDPSGCWGRCPQQSPRGYEAGFLPSWTPPLPRMAHLPSWTCSSFSSRPFGTKQLRTVSVGGGASSGLPGALRVCYRSIPCRLLPSRTSWSSFSQYGFTTPWCVPAGETNVVLSPVPQWGQGVEPPGPVRLYESGDTRGRGFSYGVPDVGKRQFLLTIPTRGRYTDPGGTRWISTCGSGSTARQTRRQDEGPNPLDSLVP